MRSLNLSTDLVRCQDGGKGKEIHVTDAKGELWHRKLKIRVEWHSFLTKSFKIPQYVKIANLCLTNF